MLAGLKAIDESINQPQRCPCRCRCLEVAVGLLLVLDSVYGPRSLLVSCGQPRGDATTGPPATGLLDDVSPGQPRGDATTDPPATGLLDDDAQWDSGTDDSLLLTAVVVVLARWWPS